MKRLVLTDALIREALSPDPHTTAPAGLLAQITADVAQTPQHRTLRFPALPQSRRFAWVLVGAATLLALLGVAARLRRLAQPVRGVPAPGPVAAAASGPSAGTNGAGDRGDQRRRGLGERRARTGCGTGPRWAGPDRSSMEPHGSSWDRLDPRPRAHARRPDGRRRRQRPLGWRRAGLDEGDVVRMRLGRVRRSHGVIWTGSSRGRLSPSGRTRGSRGRWQPRCTRLGQEAGLSPQPTTVRSGRPGSGTRDRRRRPPRVGTCIEVKPWGDGATHEVMSTRDRPRGQVAAMIFDSSGDLSVAAGSWPGTASGGPPCVMGGSASRDGEGPLVRDRMARYGRPSTGSCGATWMALSRSLATTSAAGPVSVAPDGSVWFVAQDAATGDAFVDRLLPGDAAMEPTPTPTASPQAELKTDGPGGGLKLRLVGTRPRAARGRRRLATTCTTGSGAGPMRAGRGRSASRKRTSLLWEQASFDVSPSWATAAWHSPRALVSGSAAQDRGFGQRTAPQRMSRWRPTAVSG